MKKTLIASALLAMLSTTTQAKESINIGVLLGFTGPIESMSPDMANSAELAIKEVSESGALLDGLHVSPVRADSSCVDSAVATAAAERLITSDKVAAIVGADCSGVTTAVVNNIAVPNGVVMISPSATSPALSAIKDKGYFFRTPPSDARQGEVLAQIVVDRGIKNVAISYTNNDYGKGLSDAFSTAFSKLGGQVAITAAHEDGKADYSAEIGALAASGAEELVVLGYADQGGKGIVQAALDTGAFDRFIFPDGMISDSLTSNFGSDLNGSFGTLPGSDSEGSAMFLKLAKENGFSGDGVFRAESYDAAALIMLAIQASGSTERAGIQSHIMGVANAPGEKIYPGELAKALKILADGGEVDYQGATTVEFNDIGEASGSYKEQEVSDGKFNTIKIH